MCHKRPKEILDVDSGGQFTAVPVKLGDQSPELGTPQVLFQPATLARALYAVSRDGTRFLLPARSAGSQGEVPLTIVLNRPDSPPAQVNNDATVGIAGQPAGSLRRGIARPTGFHARGISCC